MVIRVLPGVDRFAVLEQLRQQRDAARTLSVAEDARRWVFAYLKWASAAAGALSGLVARDDVNELVLTRRYELLVGSAAGLAVLATEYDNDPEAVASDALADLVCIEVNDRIAVFDAAIADLDQRMDRWRAGTSTTPALRLAT